jgi:alpha-glucoside transport system permease protein
MQDASNVMRLLGAIAAIIVGSGGIIALFYIANLVVNRLPPQARSRILPWVYMAPAMVVLGAFLVLPTIRTIILSFMDRRSQGWVGLDNYIFAFTNSDMLIAFRNNVLWLVLVTGVSVGLGLVIAVLVDRVQVRAPGQGADLFAHGDLLCGGQRDLAVYVYAYQPPGLTRLGC